MTQRRLVTVAIPAYNSEWFLADALASVFAQTYQCHECIVVDDGSTDGTADIAASFPGVRCVTQDNRGVAAARNRAIAEAVGDLIAFLDADDVWLPTKIERQIECFDRDTSLGMVYTGLKVVDVDLRPLETMHPASGEAAFKKTLLVEKPYMTGIGSSSVLPIHVARAILFDERLIVSEDWAFACQVAMRHRVEAVNEPMVLYRQHDPGQLHRDLRAVERDMHLGWAEIFDDTLLLQSPLRHGARRARSNLYLSLAAGYLRRGDAVAFARYLGRAIRLRPDRVVAALVRYSLRSSR